MNVCDESVKIIELRLDPLDVHLFNILCEEIGSTPNAFLVHSNIW